MHKKWWFWASLLAVVVVIAVIVIKEFSNKTAIVSQPPCSANLEGTLTYPLIDLSKIGALTPLGNLNPPGHTAPVDHIYFTPKTAGKIALYAPADATITNIIRVSRKTESAETNEYVVQYTLCKGLVLDFAGYSELNQSVKDKLDKTELKGCSGEIKKEGHKGAEKQCGFDFNYKVKAGELIGYTQTEIKFDSLSVPFEIWAANYNKPAPSNIDWSFYDGDDRYAHIMCPFDLYAGDLKNQFYAKLGEFKGQSQKDEKTGKVLQSAPSFKPRTIEPICGTVNQNIVGTMQGMWFGEGWKNRSDKSDVDNSRQASFIHSNIDPSYAEIGNAGEITGGNASQISFIPTHSGLINREFSEVKADGQIYCYSYQASRGDVNSFGKVLAQLIDERHLKLEFQSSACGAIESFQKPYNYER